MSTRKPSPSRKSQPKSRVAMLRDPLDFEAIDEFVNAARDEAADVIDDLRRTGFFRPVGVN